MPTPTGQVFDSSQVTFQHNEVVTQFDYPTIRRSVLLAASTTYPAGTLLGELTASPGVYKVYAHANADGSQVIAAVLPRQYTTDANGNIFAGAQASAESNFSLAKIPVWFGGCFLVSELPNADLTNMAADAGGKLFDNKTYFRF